jgi:hypothetical protein
LYSETRDYLQQYDAVIRAVQFRIGIRWPGVYIYYVISLYIYIRGYVVLLINLLKACARETTRGLSTWRGGGGSGRGCFSSQRDLYFQLLSTRTARTAAVYYIGQGYIIHTHIYHIIIIIIIINVYVCTCMYIV